VGSTEEMEVAHAAAVSVSDVAQVDIVVAVVETAAEVEADAVTTVYIVLVAVF
jgi:hypothetical protein